MTVTKTGLLINAAGVFAVAAAACAPAGATVYDQTNLVSNGFVPAANIDPQLQAPWGVASSPTGPFWVSDNNNSLTTLYNGAGTKQGLVVSVNSPTGQVFNSDSAGFQIGAAGKPASFIFAGSDGTISAWNGGSGTTASVIVNNAASGASYTGLTQGSVNGASYLYAADSGTNRVAVFDSSFRPVSLGGNFTDPSLPVGYTVFNTQILNGHLFVAYANFATSTGAVSEFDLSGNFIKQVAIGGTLKQAWGLDLAPSSFGQYANDLLVGNLDDGKVSVFDPATDAFLGQLDGANGQPIADPGLWALVNGNGGAAGSTDAVYFTAEGASGVDGVFGSIVAIPEPGSIALVLSGLFGLLWLRRRAAAGRRTPEPVPPSLGC